MHPPLPKSDRMAKTPTFYSPAVAGEVCRRVRQGQSLAEIGADPGMPGAQAIQKWKRRLPGFAAELERARAVAAAMLGAGHSYSPELADAFCARVAAGETVSAICADPAMPNTTAIYAWLARHPDFAARYEHAKALRAEADLGPVSYSQKIADAFCARMAAGEPMRKISARPGMPSPVTVYRWLCERPDFAERYERARELRRLGGANLVPYSEAVAEEICERLSCGESVAEIAADPTLPAYSTIQAWRRARPEFARRFDEAREMAAEMVEDRILHVINTVTPETASADRVKLAGLSGMAARRARQPAPAQTCEPLTIRFVDGPGEDYYYDVDERKRQTGDA
jgi:hypothetical protein